ncbi:MAG: hypothetical protein IKX84_02800 [Clostridia bacterium]|nr:hypothetical protein [Clostridia bacterium]
MNTISFILNALLFLAALYILAFRLPANGRWNKEQVFSALRFFTVLSNIFCALGAGIHALYILMGRMPQAVVLIRYLGTLGVTVTLITVLVFLAPRAGGLKPLLEGANLYLHLLGPLLAMADYLLFVPPLGSFGAYLWGLAPVLAYGVVYLYKTRIAPEGRRWPDFYGFNKGNVWPLNYAMMALGTLALCAIYWLLKCI